MLLNMCSGKDSRICCLFFVKQKTAYEMRISDWSFRRVLFRSQITLRQSIDCKHCTITTDDLVYTGDKMEVYTHVSTFISATPWTAQRYPSQMQMQHEKPFRMDRQQRDPSDGSVPTRQSKNGRASCRERVGQYV